MHIRTLAFADGGFVNGAGTSTSDSNLALLSDGEFVVNADAVGKYGALLNSINTGKAPKIGRSLSNPSMSHSQTYAPNVMVNMHGNADKAVADRIAGRVGQSLAANKPKDGFRYSKGQIMAGAHTGMTRAAAKNS